MTECTHCHMNLKEAEEIHAVNGLLFCSRECAIDYITNGIIRNAREAALELYSDNAEVVGLDILEGEEND